jgi:hypothetical protein
LTTSTWLRRFSSVSFGARSRSPSRNSARSSAGGRQHLEVVGVVLVGGAVEHPARALHVPEVGQLLQALAALEHQVLEQVREPRPALGFGPEPDVDVHGDADDGGGGVGDDQDAQARSTGSSGAVRGPARLRI